MGKVRLEIVIEVEESETDLFAVGSKDLREYFIPLWMNVKEEDVKKCRLFKVDDDGFYTYRHKDNYVDDGERLIFKKDDSSASNNKQ